MFISSMRCQQCGGHNVKLFCDVRRNSTDKNKFYIITITIIWCNNNNNNNRVSVDLEALLRRRLFEIYFPQNSLYFSTLFVAWIMKTLGLRGGTCCKINWQAYLQVIHVREQIRQHRNRICYNVCPFLLLFSDKLI